MTKANVYTDCCFFVNRIKSFQKVQQTILVVQKMRFGLCNLPLVHILVEIYGNHKTTVSTIKDNPPKERLAKLRHKTSSNKVHSKSISNLSLPISIQFCAKNKIFSNFPTGNYMFKVNNRNTGTRCKMCHHRCRSGVFTVNFEHISHFVPVFLLLTLSR